MQSFWNTFLEEVYMIISEIKQNLFLFPESSNWFKTLQLECFTWYLSISLFPVSSYCLFEWNVWMKLTDLSAFGKDHPQRFGCQKYSVDCFRNSKDFWFWILSFSGRWWRNNSNNTWTFEIHVSWSHCQPILFHSIWCLVLWHCCLGNLGNSFYHPLIFFRLDKFLMLI